MTARSKYHGLKKYIVRAVDDLLDGFMREVRQDPVISTSACCLYLVLLAELRKEPDGTVLLINRAEIQKYVKITRTTFQKAIAELETRGYIRYTTSYNPFLGSMVAFYGFGETILTISIQRDEVLFTTGR